VGAVLHKRLPEHFLGLWLLFNGALGLRWVALGVTVAAAVAAAAAAALAFVGNRSEESPAVPTRESSPDPGLPPAGYCPSNDRPGSHSDLAIWRHVPGSGPTDPNQARLPTQLANTGFRLTARDRSCPW